MYVLSIIYFSEEEEEEDNEAIYLQRFLSFEFEKWVKIKDNLYQCNYKNCTKTDASSSNINKHFEREHLSKFLLILSIIQK